MQTSTPPKYFYAYTCSNSVYCSVSRSFSFFPAGPSAEAVLATRALPGGVHVQCALYVAVAYRHMLFSVACFPALLRATFIESAYGPFIYDRKPHYYNEYRLALYQKLVDITVKLQ